MSVSNRVGQQGYSIVELLISMLLIGIMSGTLFIFFGSAFENFFKIQESSIAVNDKTRTLFRVAQVVRSGTTIAEASASALTIYAYFSPQDTTLSQVRYYYSATDKTIKVDRIKAVGTAPNYTYPPASKQTITLLDQTSLTGSLFTYRDANGSTGPFAAGTFKDIKTVTVDLNTASSHKKYASQLKTTVELRNRKTNL